MAQAERIGKGDWENLPLRAMGTATMISASEKGLASSRQRKRWLLDYIFHKEKKETPGHLDYYLSLTQKYPGNAAFHLKLAEIYQKRGEEQKAIFGYLQAAEIFSRENLLPQAMAIYKRVLLLNPHLVRAILKMAEIYRQMGFWAEAISQYRNVIKHFVRWGKEEKIPEVMNLIHELESQKPSMEKRVQELSEPGNLAEAKFETVPPFPTKTPVLQIMPQGNDFPVENKDFFFDLGAELAALEPMELKDIKEISIDTLIGFEEIFKELQETGIPKEVYPNFNYHLGVACREMGFNDGAIEQFQIAFDDGQNPIESAKLLSKCFREKGWFHEAQKYFEEALQMEIDCKSRIPGIKS